eukprot:8485700-Pyramimonas_sp.AAC.2
MAEPQALSLSSSWTSTTKSSSSSSLQLLRRLLKPDACSCGIGWRTAERTRTAWRGPTREWCCAWRRWWWTCLSVGTPTPSG